MDENEVKDNEIKMLTSINNNLKDIKLLLIKAFTPINPEKLKKAVKNMDFTVNHS